MDEAWDNSIQFLGTGGARFVMIRQMRSTAGALYCMGGVRMLVDPGPGCLVRCHQGEPPVDASALDAILLTHAHLDHACDVNVMIEAMTQGGRERRGVLLAPAEALEGDPPVRRYLRSYLERIEVLAAGRTIELAPGLALTTPVRHRHGGETYGFRLQTPGLCVGHVADTQWFPELGGHYAGCGVLILHTVFDTMEVESRRHILHMGAEGAVKLIREIVPRLAVLTHFGTPMLRAGPQAVAAQVAEETGVDVIAAEDGMVLDLARFVAPRPMAACESTPEARPNPGGQDDGESPGR